MIRVVCAILVIIIEDLKVHFDDRNLFLERTAIWFEPLAQKKETSKQTTDALYYQFKESVLQMRMLI